MSVRESLLQGMRSWLKGAITPALTDAQVIPGNAPGTRPAAPYLTVTMTLSDQNRHIRDEKIPATSGGAPTIKQRGHRRATASVEGFGEMAAEWLETADANLGMPATETLLDAAGFSVIGGQPLLDVSTQLDTSIEPHFARDFFLNYLVETDPETQIEHLVGEFDMTFVKFDGDPDPLVVPLTTE